MNGNTNGSNPVGSAKANIYLEDILSSLQRSKISPERGLHPESEKSEGNEVSTVASMSR
jgi:hypothetical protein